MPWSYFWRDQISFALVHEGDPRNAVVTVAAVAISKGEMEDLFGALSKVADSLGSNKHQGLLTQTQQLVIQSEG